VAFYNIDDLTKDYYNYDVISNVERVTPENYTFPAVTICANSFYTRSYYTNNSLVREDNKIYNSNLSMKNFILQKFPGFTTEQIRLEFFQLPGLDFRPIQLDTRYCNQIIIADVLPIGQGNFVFFGFK
jgi:hypothetical protein